MIDELFKGGVMIEEDKPLVWCTKRAFVDKEVVNGIPRVRLVTDYKKLNDTLTRPVHESPRHR